MFVSVNALQEHLRTRQFVVTAALRPPKCAGADEVRERARLLVGHVDAAIVADNPNGAIAMAPIAVGAIAQQMGLEVVVEIAGRDRNRAALQSDLLGASALGLNVVLIAIGRQWQDGSEGTAPVVDDLRGLSLVRAATSLRNGTFLDGKPMEHPPSLFVGGSLLPTEMDLALEAVKAGVDFVVAGPVVEIGPQSRMIEASANGSCVCRGADRTVGGARGSPCAHARPRDLRTRALHVRACGR
jgi:5,10-methylenetetrahydrofolate reductase